MNPPGDPRSYHRLSVWWPMDSLGFVGNVLEWKWRNDSTGALISNVHCQGSYRKPTSKFPDFSLTLRKIISPWLFPDPYEPWLCLSEMQTRLVHFDHFFIGCIVSADYWLADYPELRWTTQPSTIGGLLGEPGFCFFCSTVSMMGFPILVRWHL